jgi:hypothetical protein
MRISMQEGHYLKNDDALRRKQLLAPASYQQLLLGLSGLNHRKPWWIDTIQTGEDMGSRSKSSRAQRISSRNPAESSAKGSKSSPASSGLRWNQVALPQKGGPQLPWSMVIISFINYHTSYEHNDCPWLNFPWLSMVKFLPVTRISPKFWRLKAWPVGASRQEELLETAPLRDAAPGGLTTVQSNIQIEPSLVPVEPSKSWHISSSGDESALVR